MSPSRPLANGAATTITVVAKAVVAGLVTNTATVAALGPSTDPRPANNTASITVNVGGKNGGKPNKKQKCRVGTGRLA